MIRKAKITLFLFVWAAKFFAPDQPTKSFVIRFIYHQCYRKMHCSFCEKSKCNLVHKEFRLKTFEAGSVLGLGKKVKCFALTVLKSEHRKRLFCVERYDHDAVANKKIHHAHKENGAKENWENCADALLCNMIPAFLCRLFQQLVKAFLLIRSFLLIHRKKNRSKKEPSNFSIFEIKIPGYRRKE